VCKWMSAFDKPLCSYGEDLAMGARTAAHYPVWYEVEPLALYRIHSQSLTGKASRTGQNGRDLRQVIEINKSSLPKNRMVYWTAQAKKNFASACLRRASRMLNARDFDAAFAQIREAIRTYRSWPVITRALLLFMRYSWFKLTRLRFKQSIESDSS